MCQALHTYMMLEEHKENNEDFFCSFFAVDDSLLFIWKRPTINLCLWLRCSLKLEIVTALVPAKAIFLKTIMVLPFLQNYAQDMK